MANKETAVTALQIFHSIGLAGDPACASICEVAYKKSSLTFDGFLSWVVDAAETVEKMIDASVREGVIEPLSMDEYNLARRGVGEEIYAFIAKKKELPSKQDLMWHCSKSIKSKDKRKPQRGTSHTLRASPIAPRCLP